MRIFLTGGAGMVGRNILEHHNAAKHAIFAPTRRELNLLDSAAVLEYIKQVQPEMIVHAAGRVGGIQANIAHPVAFFTENLDMARNVIGSALAVGTPKVLNLGSSCIYPRAGQNPLREESILTGELEPTNEGYALAKLSAMRFCQYIRIEHPHLLYKTVIPCNLYGRHDKFDPMHSHLIPALVHKIHIAKLDGVDVVEVWGDGTARREFMDGSDLADFIFEAINRFDVLPDLLNVGLGFDYSINEYYATVAKVVGWNGRFVHDLSKPVGMKQKLVSIERLTAFGWRPKVSLEEGIRKAYDFYLNAIKEGQIR